MAAVFAGVNVVGGYGVTGRMLQMFRKKAPPPELASADGHKSLDGHKGLRGLADKVGAGRGQS